MYVRSRNPEAGTARARTRREETSTARYISTERARYGTTDVARSSRLRPTRGRTYGPRASRQQGRSLEGLALRVSPIAVVVLRSERAISPPLGPTTARRYTWRRIHEPRPPYPRGRI